MTKDGQMAVFSFLYSLHPIKSRQALQMFQADLNFFIPLIIRLKSGIYFF